MKTLKKQLVWIIPFILPLQAFAQSITAPITSVQGIVNIMCKAFDYLFYGLIALSIVVVVIAAFNYVLANGDAEKVSKANKMILYAMIGIAVALLAKGIPLIVGSFFGVAASAIKSC